MKLAQSVDIRIFIESDDILFNRDSIALANCQLFALNCFGPAIHSVQKFTETDEVEVPLPQSPLKQATWDTELIVPPIEFLVHKSLVFVQELVDRELCTILSQKLD